MEAIEIGEGNIFKDNDGSKYKRVQDGCVHFSKEGIHDFYTDDQMKNYAFFQECKVLQGRLKIKIKKC